MSVDMTAAPGGHVLQVTADMSRWRPTVEMSTTGINPTGTSRTPYAAPTRDVTLVTGLIDKVRCPSMLIVDMEVCHSP
jgi:hypothetical protein